MAIYKIFPTKDATLYNEDVDMNTGIDPILECSTYKKDGNYYLSRYLIKFSQDEINSTINNLISGSTYKSYLINYASEVNGLNLDTVVSVFPVSGSWEMGTGAYNNNPTTENGVSWKWTDYKDSNEWLTSSFATYVTSSYPTLTPGGGVWYTSSALGYNLEHTQSYSYSNPLDLKIDVSNTVTNWYSGSINNEGFIVKQQDETTTSDNNLTNISLFSIDTHTIYPPSLEFRWDDYLYNTGSNSNGIVNTDQIIISLNNLKENYYLDDVEKFRLNLKLKYPPRVFSTSSYYSTNFFLPENSTYAIKDEATNEYAIEFDDDFTKISADERGNYFNIYMRGLEPERYYTILVKATIDGSTKVYDFDNHFRIINR